MPDRVATTDPDGVDHGWVMQVTFVATIVVGAPVVALLSTTATLPTWSDRALFAVRVGAVVWFLTAVVTFLYARRRSDDDLDAGVDSDADAEETTADPTSTTPPETRSND